MNEIVLKNYEQVGVVLSEDAFNSKIAVLKEIKLVPDVIVDEFGEQAGYDALSNIKRFRKEFEATRKKVKESPMNTCREIDRIAAEFDRDLEAAQIVLEKRLSDREKEKRRVAEEAERKRREEERRIQEEKARIAEEQRLAQEEANRKLMEAKSADEARQAIEQKNAQEAALADQAKAVQKEEIAHVTAPTVRTFKAEGARAAKEVWDYEITDLNAAFAARPGLFDIVPKRREILKEISNGMRSCPGMKISSDIKVGAKT